MNKNFGRIGILLGGPSSEREISIKSGTAVYNALRSMGLDVVAIDIKGGESAKKQIQGEVIDIAFIALHGRFGEDGTIQTILEDISIPYTGSGPRASRLALDKILSREIFLKNNIPVPRSKPLRKDSKIEEVLEQFSLPFVVKPSREGSSIGMAIVDNADNIKDAIECAFSYDADIIVEDYIDGEDITVGILDDRPLPIVHIRPKARFYSYDAKYTAGMSEYAVPAKLNTAVYEQAQELGALAHKLLGCRCFSRVDMLFNKKDNSMVVLEVNTIPGLTSSSLLPKAAAAAGIDFTNMCLRMLGAALKGDSDYGEKAKKNPQKKKVFNKDRYCIVNG